MSDVCATHGAAYISRFGSRMPSPQRRVLQLLADCGTDRLGRVSYRCARCAAAGKAAVHHTNASCGNRHCPNCQTANNGLWCADQVEKLLPSEYFFVTFTIPDTLRAFVRSNQKLCYDALLKSAAYALRIGMADPKFCGVTETGFTSVLHTFGRDLVYHPHVHVIVPGGGLNSSGAWKSVLPTCLVPTKVLSSLFRTKFEQLVGDRADESGIDRSEFRRNFVSFVKSVGNGVATLKYLSRYMFRTAITNKRIVAMKYGHVTFSYRRHGEHRDRAMTPPAGKFLARFLQHVLPRGFHRVRHYGFLSRRSQTNLDELRTAIVAALADVQPDFELEAWTVPSLRRTPDTGPTCPTCGGPLTFERFQRIRPPPLTHRRPTPAHRSF